MVTTTGRGSSPQSMVRQATDNNNSPVPHRPNTPHSARNATAQRINSAGPTRRPGSAAANVPTGLEDTESQSGPGQEPHTTTPVPPNVP